MKCPYCGHDADKVKTGNSGDNQLYVGEDEECFDADISMFQCTDDQKHIFYCDDFKGNKISKDTKEYISSLG